MSNMWHDIKADVKRAFSTAGAEANRQWQMKKDREAQARGDAKHVSNLLHVLHHYLRSYPGACPDSHPWSSIF